MLGSMTGCLSRKSNKDQISDKGIVIYTELVPYARARFKCNKGKFTLGCRVMGSNHQPALQVKMLFKIASKQPFCDRFFLIPSFWKLY